MFKKILVPTDGSTHAAKAERLGIDLASKYGAELVFLSVIEGGALSPTARQLALDKGLDAGEVATAPDLAMLSPEGAPVVLPPEYTLASSRIQAELADRLVGDAKESAEAAGIERVTALTTNGAAAEAILSAAKEGKADLIVMGSRGLGSFRGLLMGSVSQKVAHLTECTCISVK